MVETVAKTIAEAFEGVTEESLTKEGAIKEVGTDVADDKKDNTDVDEGDPKVVDDDEPDIADEDEDAKKDEPDEEDEWGESADDDDDKKDDDDEGEDGDDEGEDGDGDDESDDGDLPDDDDEDVADDDTDLPDDDDDEDPVFKLTPEQFKTIQENPEMKVAYKGLMRAYNKVTAENAQVLELGNSYKADPRGVLKAMAAAQGGKIEFADDNDKSEAETEVQENIDKIAEARKDVEGLFGDEHGPEVREKLENFFNVITDAASAPLKESLQHINDEGDKARMASEEAAFESRHRDVLNDDIRAKVIELGNSGKIVPGKDMDPDEYLDTLLDVVLSKQAPVAIKKAKRQASKKLAEKIEKNKQKREPRGRTSKSDDSIKKVSRLVEDPGSFKGLGDALDFANSELKEEG